MRSIAAMVLAIAAAAILAAGCGGGGYGSGGTETGGEGTVVTARETDFRIALSRDRFTPGTYTFVAKNQGEAPHALEVEGDGLEEETETLDPGKSSRLTVRLDRGTYEIYCPVGDHAERGMSLEIRVR